MFTPGWLVTQATTMLLVVLGLFVATVRPRTRASLAFATYAFAAGLGTFFANLGGYLPTMVATDPAALLLDLVAGVALAVLLVTFPRAAGPAARTMVWGASVALLGFSLWASTVRGAGTLRVLVETPAAILAPLAVGAVYLALRFRREEDVRMRSQLALMSAGTLPFLAVATGDRLLGDDAWVALPQAILLAAGTLLWITNSARGDGSSRIARNVAIVIPATMLAGMAARAWVGPVGQGNIDDTAVYGLSRIIAFAVLSYAILRFQLLGIEVKVRWTISKSTIAAIFIAVFFIVSEAAQQFFGETFDSNYLGILAAGALVFAIAPLSRLADRLAAKAVPIEAPPQDVARPSEAHRDFHQAYLAAARDGRITHEEEVALARLATRLGVDAAAVLEIRRDAIENAARTAKEARRP